MTGFSHFAHNYIETEFEMYDNRLNRITATPSKESQVGLGSFSWFVSRVISKRE